MKESSNDINVQGTGCTGLLAILLTVLFVALKLTGYIDWSWVWVLSPLWITVVLGAVIAVAVIIVTIFIVWLID